MKKQILLYVIIAILIFVIGFLAGDRLNNTGRYVSTSNFVFTTDTKEGKVYVIDGDEYIIFDLKTGEKKRVTFKKSK